MAGPLQFVNRPGIGIDFQVLSDAQMSRISYDLRQRWASHVDTNTNSGAVVVGAGTEFGTAVDTIRTVVTNTSVSSFPGATPGTSTESSYSYGQVLTSLPSTPTDLTNSYARFDESTNEFQQANISSITSEILNDVYTEMRSGDELGTFRVAVSSPGTGWVNKGTWFTDTLYDDLVAQTTYTLWLRTSIPSIPTDAGLGTALRIRADGDFQEQMINGTSPFHELLFTIMRSNLNSRMGPLRYSIGDGTNKGNFVNRTLTNHTDVNTFVNADDYRTTATPSGTAVTASNSYFLGIH